MPLEIRHAEMERERERGMINRIFEGISLTRDEFGYTPKVGAKTAHACHDLPAWNIKPLNTPNATVC